MPSSDNVAPPSSSRRHRLSDPHDREQPSGMLFSNVDGAIPGLYRLEVPGSDATVGSVGSSSSRYTGRAVPGGSVSDALSVASPTRSTKMEAAESGNTVLVLDAVTEGDAEGLAPNERDAEEELVLDGEPVGVGEDDTDDVADEVLVTVTADVAVEVFVLVIVTVAVPVLVPVVEGVGVGVAAGWGIGRERV